MAIVHFTRSEFQRFVNEHGDYSCTLPTGTAIGKRWARHFPYHTPLVMGHPTECAFRWSIGEYYDIGSKTQAGIRWSKVVLRDDSALLRGRMSSYK